MKKPLETADGRPFTWDKREYMKPIYACNAKKIVVVKGAQIGGSVWLMAKMKEFLDREEAGPFGCFLSPTKDGARNALQCRARSIFGLPPYYITGNSIIHSDTNRGINFEHSVRRRYTGSWKTFFVEELRLLDYDPIDMILSECDEFYISSTAPIHADDFTWKLFLSGTQNYFYVQCHCGHNVCPSEHFSNDRECVICPACGLGLHELRKGKFIPTDPDAEIESFQVPQTCLSHCNISKRYNEAKGYKAFPDFYASVLGIPYYVPRGGTDEKCP